MKARTRITGRLLSVSESPIGTTLAADAAAAATSITVDDASIFDETGGSLYIGSQVARYSSYDDETGVVTLTDALASAADTDDPVYRWSTLYNEIETEQSAQVAVEGDRDQADTLACDVSDTLDLLTGERGGDGENCRLELDGDVWTVISVRGQPSKSRGIKYEADDTYTLTASDVAAGSATMPLSFVPIDESLKVWAGGAFQSPTNYTISSVTVTWPLDGWEPAGMTFRFHYAHRKQLGAPIFVASSTAAVNSTSISVPIPGDRAADDQLLIGVARLLPSVPAGWTKVREVDYGIGGLTVLSKISDGTETSVTLTAGSSGDQGAVCVLYRGGTVVASAGDTKLNVPSGNNYRAPSAAGRTRVSFFLFDGVGTSGVSEEEISTVTGIQRANRTISSGLFSVAAVEGSRAVVTDATPDAAVHDWVSITVGLS